jgi:hypothetical protein
MNALRIAMMSLLFLSACAGLPDKNASRNALMLDNDAQTQVIRQLLSQSVDVAVNRLGRRNGYWANPRVRIPLPEELRRVEIILRRYGMERYAEEFAESLNRAAEATMPLAKPILLEAIRDMPLADASGIVHGNDDAATRYFRAHINTALSERLLPIVADATALSQVTGAYKRFLKKATYLDKAVRPVQQNLDAHIARAMLDGLYLLMAEEEQRVRRNPLARDTELLKKAFR